MVCWYWLTKARESGDRIRLLAVASVCFVPAWHFLVFAAFSLGAFTYTWVKISDGLRMVGLIAIFVIGLAWAVRWVERRSRHYAGIAASGAIVVREKAWNPLDLAAWYYSQRHQKLDQSIGTFVAYALLFVLAFLLITGMRGCRERYQLPLGGGEPKKRKQVVKIEKVVKKKFVINPFSAVIFNPPKIDKIKLRLLEDTRHRYEVGYGDTAGAGFTGGTQRGKVRFIRLEYKGGDWDQDFGIGADLNLLIEYNIQTAQRVASQTESRKIEQLKNFPMRESPPMVYMTGQRGIEVNDAEVKILRDYLLKKRGMIFADNGGSSGWHGQFFQLMQRVLPRIEPVRVPLDHPVHRIPNEIPFLPYVAPHGGKDAWGWVVEGRLVCYYHPGDIGDAWADGHAGVRREIWRYCYDLGVNVLFYAHAEYSKWLETLAKDDATRN